MIKRVKLSNMHILVFGSLIVCNLLLIIYDVEFYYKNFLLANFVFLSFIALIPFFLLFKIKLENLIRDSSEVMNFISPADINSNINTAEKQNSDLSKYDYFFKTENHKVVFNKVCFDSEIIDEDFKFIGKNCYSIIIAFLKAADTGFINDPLIHNTEKFEEYLRKVYSWNHDSSNITTIRNQYIEHKRNLISPKNKTKGFTNPQLSLFESINFPKDNMGKNR